MTAQEGDTAPLAVRSVGALAQALHQHGDTAVSLPRLAKMLGASASTVMRELTLLTDAQIGGVPGPGWVQVSAEDGRWMVALTEAGRQLISGDVATD